MASVVVAGVSGAERDSWALKTEEARLAIAGETDPLALPILSAEISETGETLQDLAQLVLARAREYSGKAGRISGTRRAANTAIVAAMTAAAIEAALATARAARDTFLAEQES